MRKYHPDKMPKNWKYSEKAKQINWAYNIIASYCDEYRLFFKREDAESMNPELKLIRQFKDDWLTKRQKTNKVNLGGNRKNFIA